MKLLFQIALLYRRQSRVDKDKVDRRRSDLALEFLDLPLPQECARPGTLHGNDAGVPNFEIDGPCQADRLLQSAGALALALDATKRGMNNAGPRDSALARCFRHRRLTLLHRRAASSPCLLA